MQKTQNKVSGRARWLVWSGVAALVVLHHDWWFWGSESLVFGAIPIGLAYHVMFSIAAATLWWFAVRRGWPVELEVWADLEDGQAARDRTADAPQRGAEAPRL